MFVGQEFAPQYDTCPLGPLGEGETQKKKGRLREGEAREETMVIEGYVGKEKGKKQLLWERGWWDPDAHWVERYTKKDTPAEREKKRSIDQVLSHCKDFANEVSRLEELVRSRGHILQMSPKGHCELAGNGIEYCWGKAKYFFRRSKRARTGDAFQSLIDDALSEENLPLNRVRKFARKARTYRGMYKDPACTNRATVEKMYKVAKTHRSALDMDYKLCTE